MSALALAQTKTAVGPGLTAFFLGTGGTPPYTYAVLPGGAGGSIDPNTGFYTAAPAFNLDPAQRTDTVQVTDSAAATATAQITVGNALILFCDILARELGLTQDSLKQDRVSLWNQKVFQPKDTGIYVVIMVPRCKVLANWQHASGIPGPGGPGWDMVEQFVNMQATLDVNVISRDNSALYRKEEVVMALASPYSEQQQETNAFFIGRNPSSITDLSGVDGAAIPFRYQFSVNVLYRELKAKKPDFYTTFPVAPVTVNN